MLRLCKDSEKLPKNGDLQKVVITQAKRTEEPEWLSEVSNIPLQQSVADLGIAFKNFFESRSGKRKGKKVGYPRFKKKSGRQSARFRKGGFSLKGDKVYLAKVGNMKTKPTSQMCSDCGYRWGKLDLSIRELVCLGCGTLQDRDGNASKNIEQSGLGKSTTLNGRGRECKTPLGAVFNEPSTHLVA